MKSRSPSTVEELITLIQIRHPLTEEEIVKHIVHLESQGKLVLKNERPLFPHTLSSYLRSTQAYWYWATIILTVVTTTLISTIPENAYPIVYARYVVGSIFVLFLPGYAFTKAIFPAQSINNIERTMLSVVMSLSLVPITGLLLNYTPWGIRTIPITLSLLSLTMVFATVAILREHQTSE